MFDDNVKIICNTLGKNIKYYRLLRGFSVKKLSELSKIRKNYIYKIEKGIAFGIKISQVFQLAEALKIPPKIL